MPESTGYLEGGLDVFGTPANGTVPEWVAARNRAEWSALPAAGFTPSYAKFTTGGTSAFLKHAGGTNAFYAPWTLSSKTNGSAYVTQNTNLGDVTVPYIVPDGLGIYLIRWNGYVSLTSPPTVGDATLVRFSRLPTTGSDDFRSDSYVEFGNPANHITATGLLIVDDPAQLISVFVDDEAATGLPATIAASGVQWLDIVKVLSLA